MKMLTLFKYDNDYQILYINDIPMQLWIRENILIQMDLSF